MAGKKSGFLTEPRREYLKVSGAERKKKYSEIQRGQLEAAITEQASLAIGDLILIARECETECLRSAFPPEEVGGLIDALLDRIGMDEGAGRERYYEAILKVIENRIHEKYYKQGRFFKIDTSDYPVMPSKPAYRDVKEYSRK